jgi:hypothetical protein
MAFWDETEPGWTTGDAYEEPRTSSTAVADLATAGKLVDDSGTGSPWGFLTQTLGKVVDYSLARDAVKTRTQLQQQQQQALATQPLLSTTASGVAVNPMGLILIGGLVLAVVLAARGGKG